MPTGEELYQRQMARIATIDECIAIAEKVVAAAVASRCHTEAIVTRLEDPAAHASRAGSINGAAAVLLELRAVRRQAETWGTLLQAAPPAPSPEPAS